jgi:hypothetical protein
MRKLLLRADHVVAMTPDNTVIIDGAVVVDTVTGNILDVGSAATVRALHPDATMRYLPNRLLMPGLVNGHCHSGLLRGTAEGLPVWQWLQEYIDPMHRVLTAREAEIASRLCYAEALLSGTTTIVDMWKAVHARPRNWEYAPLWCRMWRSTQSMIISRPWAAMKRSSSNGMVRPTVAFKCGWDWSTCFMRYQRPGSVPRPCAESTASGCTPIAMKAKLM